ncbi:MAG TPA: hypothetical protein VML55_12225 [Planctomycetaceae bacterium]|nr:hypothetical protein [Planctomycetaceae bacterium]
MNLTHGQPYSYRHYRRRPRAADRRFWVDVLLACLAGAILALTVAAVSS